MGQVSHSSVSSGQAITPTKYNTDLQNIQAAYNSLTAGNFHSATAIPVAALATPNNVFVYTLFAASVADSNTMGHTARLDYSGLNTAGTLVDVEISASTILTGVSSIQVYHSAAAVFSTALVCTNGTGMATRGSAFRVTSFAKTAFAVKDVLSLRANAGGTITNLRVNLLFKANLTS